MMSSIGSEALNRVHVENPGHLEDTSAHIVVGTGCAIGSEVCWMLTLALAGEG